MPAPRTGMGGRGLFSDLKLLVEADSGPADDPVVPLCDSEQGDKIAEEDNETAEKVDTKFTMTGDPLEAIFDRPSTLIVSFVDAKFTTGVGGLIRFVCN
jgi:hypothetical protein